MAGGWVHGGVCSWLLVFDVFRAFVFWTHGGFTTLDDVVPRSNWTPLLQYVIFFTAGIHGGWVDRFVGLTAVLRSAILL